MKMLGLLFVFAIALTTIGLWSGWFAVAAASSTGETDALLIVDSDGVAEDTQTFTNGARRDRFSGRMVADATDVANAIEGLITGITPATREVTVEVATGRSVHHVTALVPITRLGVSLAFADLRANMRARLTFISTRLLTVVVLP